MYQEFQLSLYDFFGYFFPGLIIAGPFIYFSWPGGQELIASSSRDAVFWIWIVLLSYITGHAVQAFANIYLKGKYTDQNYYDIDDSGIPSGIETKVREKIQQEYGFSWNNLGRKSIYRICDRATLSGTDGLREIYVYREGFYRGMYFSSCILAVFLCMRLIYSFVDGSTHASVFSSDRIRLAAAVFLTVIAAILFFKRYERFRGYRIRHALLGFLVKKEQEKSG